MSTPKKPKRIRAVKLGNDWPGDDGYLIRRDRLPALIEQMAEDCLSEVEKRPRMIDGIRHAFRKAGMIVPKKGTK